MSKYYTYQGPVRSGRLGKQEPTELWRVRSQEQLQHVLLVGYLISMFLLSLMNKDLQVASCLRVPCSRVKVLVSFFRLFLARTHGMWQFLSQGSNLHPSSDPSHSSDNAESLTARPPGNSRILVSYLWKLKKKKTNKLKDTENRLVTARSRGQVWVE